MAGVAKCGQWTWFGAHHFVVFTAMYWVFILCKIIIRRICGQSSSLSPIIQQIALAIHELKVGLAWPKSKISKGSPALCNHELGWRALSPMIPVSSHHDWLQIQNHWQTSNVVRRSNDWRVIIVSITLAKIRSKSRTFQHFPPDGRRNRCSRHGEGPRPWRQVATFELASE